MNRDLPTFSHAYICFLLTLSLLWSSLFFPSRLWLFPPLLFHLSILSEVWLQNFLWLNEIQQVRYIHCIVSCCATLHCITSHYITWHYIELHHATSNHNTPKTGAHVFMWSCRQHDMTWHDMTWQVITLHCIAVSTCQSFHSVYAFHTFHALPYITFQYGTYIAHISYSISLPYLT